MASSAASTTTPFKSSVKLQTQTVGSRTLVSSLPDTASDANEAKYWAEKFGLGNSINPTQQYSHYRQVSLTAGSAAIVHQLIYLPSHASQKFIPLATVCGPRVQIYGATAQSSFHRQLSTHSINQKQEATVEHDRQIATGGQLALAADFRGDGRLLAIASDQGQIRIVDVDTKAVLCTWETSSQLPVRAIQWFRDGQHILAVGDDGLVTVWQLKNSSGKPIVTCTGHGDAVRCAALWQLPERRKDTWAVSSLAASGSYDHTVRLWNMEDLERPADRCLSILSHGSPVETVVWLRSTDALVPVWLASAGGTSIKIWNPLSGSCIHNVNTQHRKTVTCIVSVPRKDFIEDGWKLSPRILTGSLDGVLRVHSWDDRTGKLQHLHGVHFNEAITSLATSSNVDQLAIGTAHGKVYVRQRGPSVHQRKRTAPPLAGTYSFFTRGMNVDANNEDYFVSPNTGKKPNLKKFDVALKQFRYGDALDEALETRNPQLVIAVLEELGRRRGLSIAVSHRDEESLEPILAFTVRYLTWPRFASLLIGVAHKLLDVYGPYAGQSEKIDELLAKLRAQVDSELKTQKILMQVVGQLDTIMTAVELDMDDSLV